MAAGSAGYLVANNTEILLVTTIFGPVTAAVYALTRRTLDGLRSLLDAVAWAVYGAFAHLVSADDRHRARAVPHEILWIRFAAACLCGAVAVSINRPFVSLLYGAENFGGLGLTTAFALQMILGGQAFLANYLLRAAGRVKEEIGTCSAGKLWFESPRCSRVFSRSASRRLRRVAAVTSTAALIVMLRWLDHDLPASGMVNGSIPLRSQLAPVLVLALGLAFAIVGGPASWSSIVAVAGVVGGTGAALLWLTRPRGAKGESLLRWSRT